MTKEAQYNYKILQNHYIVHEGPAKVATCLTTVARPVMLSILTK